MDNLVEIADKYKARRREALQNLISQGLREGAYLEFKLHPDIEDGLVGDLPLVMRKVLEIVSRDDEREDSCLRGSGYCASYEENNGLIRLVPVWDDKSNCTNKLFRSYYLGADVIFDPHITIKVSLPVSA